MGNLPDWKAEREGAHPRYVYIRAICNPVAAIVSILGVLICWFSELWNLEYDGHLLVE